MTTSLMKLRRPLTLFRICNMELHAAQNTKQVSETHALPPRRGRKTCSVLIVILHTRFSPFMNLKGLAH